jgi:UDP-3-O-[3-hydroxymyristoyl] N-acetylglucosamine deacetylase
MPFQTTIKKEVNLTGTGLHNGLKSSLSLRPAEPGTGILFLTAKGKVKASYKNIADGNFALTLVSGKAKVITAEHLLAALYGAGVDNVICELSGSAEVPILDGSAWEFSKAIKKAGLVTFSKKRKEIRIKEDVLSFDMKAGRFLKVEKANKLEIRYYASYDNPAIGEQYRAFTLSKGSFLKEIGRARTFGWAEQVKEQRRQGFIKGGSVKNAILFSAKGVVNKEGLRYKDEIIRHKIMDLLGALALLPSSIKGRFTAFKSGHNLDIKMIKTLGGLYDR